MLSIDRVRLDSVTVKPDATGKQTAPEVEGSYSLISNKDTILATNTFNGYNSMKISPSPETAELLHKLLASLAKDLERVLGFNEE